MLLLVKVVAFTFRYIINSFALFFFLLILFSSSSIQLGLESGYGILSITSSKMLRARNAGLDR